MDITPYHSKYFAYELTRRGGTGVDRLSQSLFDASVDLNPHQVEAALFAFRSPLSKGVLLADEVGLGKTIEAGLVLCQYWAERRRKLLVICPASLRKQWSLELQEKFNLPCIILESKNYREHLKKGTGNLFQQDGIIITSMNFANSRREDVRLVPWDLVVIDEAHKLRNVYRPGNKMGQGIKWALEGRKKLLLTATPLQNTLLELYGLSTLIDDYIFGDLTAFRTQYANSDGDLDALRMRLQGFCKRTLRSQVLEYIRYTERRAITRPFRPNDSEQKLYEAISSFLRREDTYAIPRRQRTLTTLILRKLLASSSFAVAGTLETIKARLTAIRSGINPADDDLIEKLADDNEFDDFVEEEAETEDGYISAEEPEGNGTVIDAKKLDAEIAELEQYITWARSINIDTKTTTLLSALDIGFEEMKKIGANRKALIFTESRRTQAYLKNFLEANGYAGKIAIFNGTNTDPESRGIFNRWLKENKDTGRISGSRTADNRIALIEYFRDKADIMIATESAAEGINLQFCSLVINYDLPWNPQRIEQRIGRCHRYGQKHDVVVINFLNERNEADRRVYELLQEKFSLFTGVLGASDEVLGTIESGVDFERRILDIYQQCRTLEEIETAFNKLQQDMEQAISARIENTRRALLEHFDEDVHARLKVNLDETRHHLDRYGKLFWNLSRFILADKADFFDDTQLSFKLTQPPVSRIPAGMYHMISKTKENMDGGYLYRLSHPLGEYVVDQGLRSSTPPGEIAFNISDHPVKISVVDSLKGKSGYLTLSKLTIDSFDREEHLLFNAFTDDGNSLDQEICRKLFQCAGKARPLNAFPKDKLDKLVNDAGRHAAAVMMRSLEENQRYFREERERLEKWAEDLVFASEKELKDTKEKIKALNRQARIATTLEEQHGAELKIQELTKLQRRQRQRIFDVEDEIVAKRDGLIADLEKRMMQKSIHDTLFTIRWKVV